MAGCSNFCCSTLIGAEYTTTPLKARVAAATAAAQRTRAHMVATNITSRNSAQRPPEAKQTVDSSPRQFSFGICTDVQYADLPTGAGYTGRARFYRDSLHSLKRAVSGWKSSEVEFGMHLGDLLDGNNPRDQREVAMTNLLDAFSGLGRPVYHVIGNHCLYNFNRQELNGMLDISCSGSGSYYSFSPHQNWRFVIIDTFDVSIMGTSPGSALRHLAEQTLHGRNGNENKNDPTGLDGLEARFVQFGGGVSQVQLTWLTEQLADATSAGQRVVCFSHQPLHPESVHGSYKSLCWNYNEVLEVMQKAGNVVASFSGHAHKDGMVTDESTGTHFRVLSSILETPPGHDCYATVDVHSSHLELHAVGSHMDSQHLTFSAPHGGNGFQ